MWNFNRHTCVELKSIFGMYDSVRHLTTVRKALELLQKVDVGCMTKLFDVDVSRV